VEAGCSQASRPSTRNPVSSKCASSAPAIRCRTCSVNASNSPAARPVAAATVPSLTGTPNSSAIACAVRFLDRKLADVQIDDQRRHPRSVLHRRGHRIRGRRPGGGATPALLGHQLVLGHPYADRRDVEHLPVLHPGLGRPAQAPAAPAAACGRPAQAAHRVCAPTAAVTTSASACRTRPSWAASTNSASSFLTARSRLLKAKSIRLYAAQRGSRGTAAAALGGFYEVGTTGSGRGPRTVRPAAAAIEPAVQPVHACSQGQVAPPARQVRRTGRWLTDVAGKIQYHLINRPVIGMSA
jgi:hypothetical protein